MCGTSTSKSGDGRSVSQATVPATLLRGVYYSTIGQQFVNRRFARHSAGRNAEKVLTPKVRGALRCRNRSRSKYRLHGLRTRNRQCENYTQCGVRLQIDELVSGGIPPLSA